MILVSVSLVACAGSPRSQKESTAQEVPANLVPHGFTPGECRYVRQGEVTTREISPGGLNVATGETKPQIECNHPGSTNYTLTSVPVCHSQSGKSLPLSDCCMKEDGTSIPACTPKIQPPGE